MTSDPVALPDHLRLRACRHGTMLYSPNDRYCGRMLDLYGEFSEGEHDVFAGLLRPGMTVVEAGANIGAHTLGIAHLVGPTGRVLAFEPQRPIFQIMCANMALNGIACVEAHWAAVGSAPASLPVPRLDLRMSGNFGGIELGAGRVTVPAPEEPVPVVTLDSFALPACHMVKIDVEGMEAEVLRGAAATIARCRPVIYAENDRPERSPELLGLIESMGYRAYWHIPPYVRMPNFRGYGQNEYPGIVSLNVLCIHQNAPIEITGLAEARIGGPWPI